jgi:hypothetical protein
MISNAKLGNAKSHSFNSTGAIGHWNAWFRRTPHAADDGIIVMVQRICLEPNGDFSRTR